MQKKKDIIYQQIHSEEYIDTQINDQITLMNKFVDRLQHQQQLQKSQATYVVEERPYLRAQTAYVDSIQTQFFENRRQENDKFQKNRHFEISNPNDNVPLRVEMLQEDNVVFTQLGGFQNANLHRDHLYKVRQQLNERLQTLQNGLLGETLPPINNQQTEHSFNFENQQPLNNSMVQYGNCYSPNVIAPFSTGFQEKQPTFAPYAPFSTNIYGAQPQPPFSVENEEVAKSWMESLSELRDDVKQGAQQSNAGSRIDTEINANQGLKNQIQELQSDVNYLKQEVGQLRSFVNDCLANKTIVENQDAASAKLQFEEVQDLKAAAQNAVSAKQTEAPQVGKANIQCNNFQTQPQGKPPLVKQQVGQAAFSLQIISKQPSAQTFSQNDSQAVLLLPSTNNQVQAPQASLQGQKSQSKLRGLLKNCREPVNNLGQPNQAE